MCLLALSMAVKYTMNDNRLKNSNNNNNKTNNKSNNNNNSPQTIAILTLNTAEMKITQKLKMQPQ